MVHLKRLSLLTLACLALSGTAQAQERLTEHTLKLSADAKSPAASLQEMAWLVGHWTGDGLGGVSEEIWSAPANGVMMGMYRHTKNDKPNFYEFLTLAEENGSLILRIKHFSPTMVGWEEKDKSTNFPFVAKKDGVLHFDGIAFKPEGTASKDGVTIFLALHNRKDGSVREEVFHYRRVNPAFTPISAAQSSQVKSGVEK